MQIGLVIAEWNANGVLNHVNEIEYFLKTNLIDILLVSDTHLTQKSYFKIHGYDIIQTNHPDDRAHGGAAVIIKSTIKYEVGESFSEPYLQATGVTITCNHSKIDIYSVYFPPRFSVKCEQFNKFFKSIGNSFIVGGDFNAKHTWWGSRLINPKGRELYKCISSNHYNVLSTGSPTYWPSDSNKIPDLLDFVVFNGVPPTSLQITDSYDLSSDHSPIIITFFTSQFIKSKISMLFSRRTDIGLFQSYIEDNVNLKMPIKTEAELEEAEEMFTNLIHRSALMATPQDVEQNISKFKISFEIKKLIKLKRRLRKVWQSTRSPTDKTNFNRAVRVLQHKLKAHKNNSEDVFALYCSFLCLHISKTKYKQKQF